MRAVSPTFAISVRLPPAVRPVTTWEKLRDRNEALDCRVYSRAAACRNGLDRMQEGAFDHLEGLLGGAAKPAQVAPVSIPRPAPAAALPRKVIRSSLFST